MSSGTPLRIHFIKLHSFGLSVPEDYLFASEELLIPLAAVYQAYADSKCRSTDENTELTSYQRFALYSLR